MANISASIFRSSLINSTLRCSLRNKSTKKKKNKNRKPLSPEKRPFLILRAQKEDYKPILSLMWGSYYDDEPTLSALGIRPNTCLDQSIMKTLEEGISVVSKCRYTGDVVGACINETTNPWEPDMLDKLACSMACPKMRALYHFYAHLQRMPNLWECYKVPKIFEMSHIFTQRSDRGKGLATDMIRASRDIAADCGYKVARIDCTSYYTCLICEKLKFKLITEIPYCAYIGEDLDPIFKTTAPHTSAKVYVDDALHERR